ncbi:MAG: hypothetical protein JGK12_10795 [Microcoleus sp. PH2017_01_SCD_O_A]|uniref:hypothetical protein n=1 Tax=unclassified Microcoleus TaxID=2642155 RepID=UPI001DC910C2|nr:MULTISPECIES: hypothetical protein [unclassified Microcoleus]MCC3432963.1 hypothetical protein [Microcoleus sp. PH2017_04_SCI_O_A]MCC3508047.1 hypothetical protein [Microcoleus sp. PH2017_17_BER_D_A]MCC3424402.1 hypothetical protein [Microcoleus sp. PH2017_01_SCD_O_A]MCC3451664.1 hypothetical protein [Microcoleus sp. PH2017_09_SFU_O_A]MCC3453876.1 hypothetical protein [Microcoleus sp. PH2017_08_TRC_O_A]
MNSPESIDKLSIRIKFRITQQQASVPTRPEFAHTSKPSRFMGTYIKSGSIVTIPDAPFPMPHPSASLRPIPCLPNSRCPMII